MAISELKNKFVIYGLLCTYPTWFMGPALNPWGHKLLQMNSSSDISGSVFNAQMLAKMTFPWSSNAYLNAPEGSNFWTFYEINHAIHNIYYWMLTRVATAEFAVSSFIYIGWVSSGIAVYLLTKKISGSIFCAVYAGILCEILPWMRLKANTHVVYVYFSIPVIAVLLFLKFIDTPKLRNLIAIVVFQTILIFMDLYWFYFSAFINILLLITCGRKIKEKLPENEWKKIVKLLLFSFAIFILGFISIKLLLQVYFPESRQLSVVSLNAVDDFNRNLKGSLSPKLWRSEIYFDSFPTGSAEDAVGYPGVSILFFVFISAILMKNKLKKFEYYIIGSIATFFCLFALPTNIQIWNLKIPTPIQVVRYLMPGAVALTRGVIVAEVLLTVLAGIALSQILIYRCFSLFKRFLILTLTLFIILDLNPMRFREFSNVYSQFENMRTSIGNSENVVAYSFENFSNTVLPSNALDKPISGSMIESDFNLKTLEAEASIGQENLAACLKSKGVDYLILKHKKGESQVWKVRFGSRPSLDLALGGEYFKLIETTEYNSISFSALKINNPLGLICQESPRYYLEWSGVRRSFFEPSVLSGDEVYEDGEDVGWIIDRESPSFSVKGFTGLVSAKITLVPAFGAYAKAQVILAKSSRDVQTIVLRNSVSSQVEFTVQPGEKIEFKSILPCVLPSELEVGNSDSRKLCFGITSIRLKTIDS